MKAINLELSTNQNLTLATMIYCRMEILTFHFSNPLITSMMMSCLLEISTGNWNLSAAPITPSGPMLKNIQKQLNLIYLNNDEHTHMDRAKSSTDILDMEFILDNCKMQERAAH